MKHLFKSIFVTGAVIGAALCAQAGQDLPINGDFYGAPTRHHIVPGWRSTPGGVRLFPRRGGKQILELIAPPNGPKIAISEQQQIMPGMLSIKADVSGRGVAALGFEAFDASRRTVIQNGKQQFQLSGVRGRYKFSFPVNAPGVAFVRITLTAEAGSIARFSDVDAEMHYAPAPAPVAPAPAPAVPAPPALPAPQMLMHEGFYTLESLPPVSVFQASVPAGSDIDFKLSENPAAGQMWTLAGAYDARICRIEMKHKFKGVGYAKIELNAMYRGTTNIEFVNPAGKRVIVQFTSL